MRLRVAGLLTILLSLGTASGALAQCVSLTTPGSPYAQNFDTLSNTAGSTTNNLTITGWFLTESGGGARDNEQYAVDTGSSNTGDTCSYGATGSTERALGGLQSGTLIPIFGACFTNNTGVTITSLDVAYTGEEWRLGTAARTDQINFEYSTGATSLVTGTWTGVATLNFVTPDTATTGAKNGNAAAERSAISSTIASLSIANGATFWIRWTDTNASGADDGLAVDDFSLTPQAGVATSTLNVSDVALAEGDPPGTTTFTFQVTLSVAAGAGGVTFDIATADGTAQDGNPVGEDNDYVAQSLTGQTIPAGSSGPYTFSVTVNRDAVVEPNETFFVNVTNITGATAGDVQGQGTIVNDDVTITPIHDIQGAGASSPLVATSVTTRGVVTGVRSNGFFIQEPDASVDANPSTSEGIFVFTSGAPPAAALVGNLVQVTGTVSEFVPSSDPLQPPLTELTGPAVSLLSAGNPLPTPIPLTTTFPDPAGAHDQLEPLEGMRVSVASLTVVGPTLGTANEPNATSTSTGVSYGVVTGVPRPFREAGIQAPDPAPSGGGTIPPIPRFDSNPERIRVDSDGLVGGPLVDVGAGAVVTGLVGPLDYSFRTYTILPDPGATIGVAGGPTPTPVTAPTSAEFTVASYNVQRFFDTVNDPLIGEPVLTAAAFDKRLAKGSLAIRDFMAMPDIIGVEEMENLSTLQALAARISADAIAASEPDPQYAAYLIEGNDVGGIDVGFLVKTAPVVGATPRVSVNAVVQELAGTLFVNPDTSTELLNDRPPLRLMAVVNDTNGASFPVTVIVNHLRSLGGVNAETAGSNGWPTDGARVRAKRQAQAEDLANLVQARQLADPAEHIILVGDFNAYEVNDGLVDSMDVITGAPVSDNETAVPGDGVDLVNPNLDDLFDTPPPLERYGYIFDGNAQNLDHVLVNAPLIADTLAQRIEHARINADFPATAMNDGTTPARLSDHDPLVGYFEVAGFATADLVITKVDMTDPVASGGSLVYTITITNNGPDAAQSVSVTDVLPTGVMSYSLSVPAAWTCLTGLTFSCSTASFAPGSAVFTLTVDVPDVTVVTILTNSVTVSSATVESSPGDETAVATTTVLPPPSASLSLSKAADPTTYSAAGDTILYSYIVTNTGNVRLDGPFTIDDDRLGTFQCSMVPGLNPGETTTCTKTDTTTAADLTAQSVSNTATASGLFGTQTITSDPASVTVRYVKATTSSAQKASLLLFPDIDVRDDVTTIVRIANDSTAAVWVKCFFMDGEKRRNDFGFLLTRGQPVWFDAFTGAGTLGANPFPTGFGAGLLACFATNSEETQPIRWNHLSGTATVINYGAGSAYEYNAWEFYAIQGARDGAPINPPLAFTMPAPCDPTQVDCTPTAAEGDSVLGLDGIRYNRCPATVIGEFSPEGATLAAGQDVIEVGPTRVVFAGCSLDLRQASQRYDTKLTFEVWSPNEIKLTGAHDCADSWHETNLSDMTQGRNFTLSAVKGDVARYRVTPTRDDLVCVPRKTAKVGLVGVQSTDLVIGGMAAKAGTQLTVVGTYNGFVVWNTESNVEEGNVR